MIKYAANAFLATKITFINEIAALCEKTGADVREVSKGMGLDGRIGNKFLHAGPGYGGSCFPKDTSALARIGQEFASPMTITEAVIEVNDRVKRRMIEKLRDLCDGSFNGKKIAVLGRDVQAEHRRHAGCAVADHYSCACRRWGKGSCRRSAGPARRRDAVASRRMGGGRLCGIRGRQPRGDPHRVE